jgi:hypothetical protein
LDKSIQLETGNPHAFAKKGECHMKLDEWHRADMAYCEGLKYHPNNSKLMSGASEVKKMVLFEVRKDSIMRDKSVRAKYDPKL